MNYKDTKAYISFSWKKAWRKIRRHLFAILADESACGSENSSSQGVGVGKVL